MRLLWRLADGPFGYLWTWLKATVLTALVILAFPIVGAAYYLGVWSEWLGWRKSTVPATRSQARPVATGAAARHPATM